MKYFSFKEMIQSDIAKSKGIENIPDWEQIDALRSLIETILDPLREWYGKSITVNSGYRSEALNSAVGGVSTSFHRYGQAADITAGNRTENEKLFNYIKDNLPFSELGWEGNGTWVHIGWNGNNDKEVFAA